MSLPAFRIPAIAASLEAFRANFSAINDSLAIRREAPGPALIANIVTAYEYLNRLLADDVDLFGRDGLPHLLEINHIVLCGQDLSQRQEVWSHLAETGKSFRRRIQPIKDFVRRGVDDAKPYRTATGFYTRMLSRPQLFLEGNHRTGNIALNYILVRRRALPYIIDPASAREYLDLSGHIKFTEKQKGLRTAFMMPGHARAFRDFLKRHGNATYLDT